MFWSYRSSSLCAYNIETQRASRCAPNLMIIQLWVTNYREILQIWNICICTCTFSVAACHNTTMGESSFILDIRLGAELPFCSCRDYALLLQVQIHSLGVRTCSMAQFWSHGLQPFPSPKKVVALIATVGNCSRPTLSSREECGMIWES